MSEDLSFCDYILAVEQVKLVFISSSSFSVCPLSFLLTRVGAVPSGCWCQLCFEKRQDCGVSKAKVTFYLLGH